MNSLVIVLFLSGMVAMIMLRTLHRDIARYNQMDNSVSNSHVWFEICLILLEKGFLRDLLTEILIKFFCNNFFL